MPTGTEFTIINTGAPGATGPTGPAGAQGAQGQPGNVGPQGSSGGQGPQGSPGPQGATGAQGSSDGSGPQGPAGPTGPTGAQGAQGQPGNVGPQGSSGGQGAQGSTGSTGPQGVTGGQGSAGPQGSAGSSGPQGPQGSTGPQGPPSSLLASLLYTTARTFDLNTLTVPALTWVVLDPGVLGVTFTVPPSGKVLLDASIYVGINFGVVGAAGRELSMALSFFNHATSAQATPLGYFSDITAPNTANFAEFNGVGIAGTVIYRTLVEGLTPGAVLSYDLAAALFDSSPGAGQAAAALVTGNGVDLTQASPASILVWRVDV